MSRILGLIMFGIAVLVVRPGLADVVPLNIDNNGIVLSNAAQIVDVTFTPNGGTGWTVNVGNGLNFEEFFFNFSQPVGLGDISINTAGWSLVTAGGGGGTAGNFGSFSAKLDGPVAGGTSSLDFVLSVGGNFVPNSKGNTFAAKISSQQGGNAGGFVSNGSISAVPLPSAFWMFLSGLTGLILLTHPTVRRKLARRRTMQEVLATE